HAGPKGGRAVCGGSSCNPTQPAQASAAARKAAEQQDRSLSIGSAQVLVARTRVMSVTGVEIRFAFDLWKQAATPCPKYCEAWGVWPASQSSFVGGNYAKQLYSWCVPSADPRTVVGCSELFDDPESASGSDCDRAE